VIDVERVDFIRVPVKDMDDVAEARAKLEAAGVHVFDVWDSGVCHGAGARDQSGNSILLHHRYAPYTDGTQP
jgi:hypothetical protein